MTKSWGAARSAPGLVRRAGAPSGHGAQRRVPRRFGADRRRRRVHRDRCSSVFNASSVERPPPRPKSPNRRMRMPTAPAPHRQAGQRPSRSRVPRVGRTASHGRDSADRCPLERRGAHARCGHGRRRLRVTDERRRDAHSRCGDAVCHDQRPNDRLLPFEPPRRPWTRPLPKRAGTTTKTSSSSAPIEAYATSPSSARACSVLPRWPPSLSGARGPPRAVSLTPVISPTAPGLVVFGAFLSQLAFEPPRHAGDFATSPFFSHSSGVRDVMVSACRPARISSSSST